MKAIQKELGDNEDLDEIAELEKEVALFKRVEAPKKLQSWLRENQPERSPIEDPLWFTLIAEPLVSKGGASFQRLEDGSYLASGVNPSSDIYTFVATSPVEQIRSLKIEALSHSSMQGGGPGMC